MESILQIIRLRPKPWKVNFTHQKILQKKKRVDINILLNNVRTAQRKEKMESTIFFSLVAAVIVVTGIIVSI